MSDKKYLALIMVGAPGSGKGTHSADIVEKYKLAHISTGDMLRENVAAKTKFGEMANEYMQKGQLVPDDVIISMVLERLQKEDCEAGCILDGFPRTVEQATALDKALNEQGKPITSVVNLIVEREEILKRLLLRGRDDDNEETINKRLDVFHAQTSPVIEYYEKQSKVINIVAEGDADHMRGIVLSALAKNIGE